MPEWISIDFVTCDDRGDKVVRLTFQLADHKWMMVHRDIEFAILSGGGPRRGFVRAQAIPSDIASVYMNRSFFVHHMKLSCRVGRKV